MGGSLEGMDEASEVLPEAAHARRGEHDDDDGGEGDQLTSTQGTGHSGTLPEPNVARNLTRRGTRDHLASMRILGHRGASGDYAENTLAAFAGAMAQGADGVELDVARCGSGELVVCHDEWLDRIAGQHWEVARTSWRRLKSLDVGAALGKAPARIPLLSEVFDALPDSAVINVELKCLTVDDRGLTDEVGRFLTRRGRGDLVFISSFNPFCLVRLAQRFPSLRRGLLLDPERWWWLQDRVWLPLAARSSVHPHSSACTIERVVRWHASGLEVAVWTVDEAEQARAFQSMGVDWLISNRPGAVRRALAGTDEVAPR
jgi:glycerophosphoryl diester phosphodiesterase